MYAPRHCIAAASPRMEPSLGVLNLASEEKINQTGPPAIPYFEHGLRDGNPKIRGGSAVALSYILAASARAYGPPGRDEPGVHRL